MNIGPKIALSALAVGAAVGLVIAVRRRKGRARR